MTRTWDRTQVSRAISEHSNHYTNVRFKNIIVIISSNIETTYFLFLLKQSDKSGNCPMSQQNVIFKNLHHYVIFSTFFNQILTGYSLFVFFTHISLCDYKVLLQILRLAAYAFFINDTHIVLITTFVQQIISIRCSSSVVPVGWCGRVHRLHLCRGVRPSNWVSWYDSKKAGWEAPVLEFWRIWSIPSLTFLPGPFLSGVGALDKILSVDQMI